MVSLEDVTSPHAVCIPFPAQGHINPMIKLAKLLHHRGFHITFVNTEYNHNRLLKSRGPSSLSGVPDFQFRAIPDSLPSSDVDGTQDIPALSNSTTKNFLAPFQELVSELNTTPSSPPVSCIVSDANMTFTLDVADQLGIPDILFWTASGCGFMGYLSYRHLVDAGIIPVKDETDLINGYLKRPVDWIPGFEDLCLEDLPSFIRTTDKNDILLNFFIKIVGSAKRATAIVLNSFEELEHDSLSVIRPNLPPIYTIGSLHLLLNQISEEKNGLNSIGSNLWKEDPKCLNWLDSKEPNSVVYVNFGSITVMTAHQLNELAWGLANSNHSFLWVIRPDLVAGGSFTLPVEFIEETKERGLLVTWCAQEQVLSHPSVACFLTHSGWNSTLESVCSGVPMICWPFFAEQQTNCRFVCSRWGIGMEIDNNVQRDLVESLVREMIEGEKGKEMKLKAMEWKKKALEAVAPGGSSSQNMDNYILYSLSSSIAGSMWIFCYEVSWLKVKLL